MTPADATPGESPPPFASFWMGGFESATHINRHGRRQDMLAATQHDWHADTDYALLRSVGIRTARDAVRWHRVERGGRYDFSEFVPMVRAARDSGVQVIWDFMHYGFPNGLDIFSPAFVERFARFAAATARVVAAESDAVPLYAPINEISFFTHMAAGIGTFAPFANGRGAEFKRQMVRAAIAAMDAVWEVDRRARFVHVDPIINVVAPRHRPDLRGDADQTTDSQWEAWDMLAGRRDRDLGGAARYLDIIGVNFYYDGQWEQGGGRLRWEQEPRDPRWMPVRTMLAHVWERYHRPFFVSETSHFGVGRIPWLREIAAEVCAARTAGAPVAGVCIYPILDRPDWENPAHWHHSGMWDLLPDRAGMLHRALYAGYADALYDAQRLIESGACDPPTRLSLWHRFRH